MQIHVSLLLPRTAGKVLPTEAFTGLGLYQHQHLSVHIYALPENTKTQPLNSYKLWIIMSTLVTWFKFELYLTIQHSPHKGV